jgi:hypothetical protein
VCECLVIQRCVAVFIHYCVFLSLIILVDGVSAVLMLLSEISRVKQISDMIDQQI